MERGDLEGWLRDPRGFRDRVARRLSGGDRVLMETMRRVREGRGAAQGLRASAVLVPLEFDRTSREHRFVLNKRSERVKQPGDLCCPGGRLDFGRDRFLAGLMAWRAALFARRGGAAPGGRSDRRQEKREVRFVLAGALRECWEEMGLPPWKVRYLGALPAEQLQNLPRVVFPLVGRVRGGWRERPNWEVEKILRLPVRAFLRPDSYVTYRLNLSGAVRERFGVDRWEVPGLAVPCDGGEEILWGLTFKILLVFMEQVVSMPIAGIQPARTVERDLPGHYYEGIGRGKGGG